MEFRILGTLEAAFQRRPVRLRGGRSQLILAALLLNVDRAVSAGRLAETVWGEHLPESARTQVAICVSGLRRVVREAGCGMDWLQTAGSGYRVRAEAVRLDAQTAEELRARAQDATTEGRTEEAAALLRQALGLWRGPVLAGLDGEIIVASARRLEDLRVTMAEELADAELSLGRHREVADELTALVLENPFRERLRGRLMTALARAGRKAEALEVYQEGRRTLVQELGLEPGRALRELHGAILRDDSSLHAASAARSRGRRPAQLPPAASAFTGRAAELRVLDDLLEGQDETNRHLPICVISGVAGVGKTGLALHWAHRAASRFPDGHLFADLHGNGPRARPTPPEAVLARWLRALGVPDHEIPRDREERAALYRSTLDGRRMLILLDNAESAAQVRPLLPGSHRCCAIVTARQPLQELLAAEGAQALLLERLSPDESVDLLGRLAGLVRVAEDPAAALRLGELCGHLPLAVRTAAVSLATHPTWTLADLTDRLNSAPRPPHSPDSGYSALRRP
ncbi:AfsR/SARP family transcriptional regulator [Actinomadura rudentiformis]|uniref:AfsR/SARP family transcriptional regulator n=1 Tax=Actinomadura rudentiformis TaxID=359158 RepID=A0A6H9YNQ7_9ACTN|nr:AfsR/SARP family transcriptional regulator [Actinomadura rudentiformis]